MLTEENRKDILKGFLQTIKSISDIEYQKRAWICGELPGTDFDETVNNYYLDAEGVFKKYKDYGITDNQYLVLKKFRDKFEIFAENNNWPHEFIDTPEWAEIMELAKEVLKVFNYKE